MTTPLPKRPPFEAGVDVCLPTGAILRGRLKTTRTLTGSRGREVWALRVPAPDAFHPEGELVSLIVEPAPDGGWQAVGGDALGAAIRMAEVIASGREVREPVSLQLLVVTAGLLALVQPEGGP